MARSPDYIKGFEAARSRALIIADEQERRCRAALDPAGEVAIRWIFAELIRMRPAPEIEPRET